MWKAAIALLLLVTIPVYAEWPARVFAPYMYVGAGDDFKLTACNDACGVKYFTLAFIIARQEGEGRNRNYLKEPSWDGHIGMGEDFYKDQINAIRHRGGDVILSFGGEAGRELAIVQDNPDQLLKDYQSIIDRYHLTWLDFDIEGANLNKHADASRRRNAVLAKLQQANPGLRISYTLPADPNGISQISRDLLTDSSACGLNVYSINLMVMYFGKEFIHKGKSEGELGIESARSAHAQIQKIDPAIRIGLCPCLGNNGSKEEVFAPEDAKILLNFANQTPWIVSLHYWSMNDDAKGPTANALPELTESQKPWTFARIFQAFTTPSNSDKP